MDDHKKTILTVWGAVLVFFIGIILILVGFNYMKNKSLDETKIYIERNWK